LDHDDDRIKDMGTIQNVVRLAQAEDVSPTPSLSIKEESELERFLSMAEYEPVHDPPLADVDVFYVRCEGEVFEVYTIRR